MPHKRDKWLATPMTGRLSGRMAASGVFWRVAALLSLCCVIAPLLNAEETPEAEKPIPYGFLFFEFKLIPGPYVIKSIDQSVTVNGVVVAESSVKAREETISLPAAPLAQPDKKGHPCDGDDESFSYWESRRKDGLTISNGDIAIARVKLAQEMNEFYGRDIAKIDLQSEDGILVKDIYKGKSIEHFSSTKGAAPGFSDSDPVKSAIESKKRFAEFLTRQMWKNNAVWIYNKTLGVAAVHPDMLGTFLGEIVAGNTAEVTYERLVKKNVIPPGDDLWARFVHGFTDQDLLKKEMASRIDQLKTANVPTKQRDRAKDSTLVLADRHKDDTAQRPARDPVNGTQRSGNERGIGLTKLIVAVVVIAACGIILYLTVFKSRT